MQARRLSGRAVAAALITTLVGLSLAIAPQASARPSFELDRLAGENRFETASEIALATFSDAPVAILANQLSFADPLAASYLAGAESAPILLTKVDDVPTITMSTLEELNVAEVTLVGGTAVISQAVVDELQSAGYAVRRIAGADRYETSRLIAEDPTAANVGTTDDGRTAFLTTGQKFPDSLSAGGGAYDGQFPLVLTTPDTLHPEAEAALDNLNIEHVVILGGTEAVSEDIETQLTEGGRTTERLSGENRFETNVAVATWLIENLDFSVTDIDVATGKDFADALAGSVHAGENTRIVILTSSVPAGTCTFLGSHEATLAGGHIFGGTVAVDAATEDDLEVCGGKGGTVRGIITAVDLSDAADPDDKAGAYRITDEASQRQIVIEYDANNDVFEVDGNTASLAAFEDNLDVGDDIAFFNDPNTNTNADADEHILTNVDRTSGMVGNVDTGENTFFIVEPVSGVIISDTNDTTSGFQPFDYSASSASFTVDGQSSSEGNFEDDINEGDAINVENGDDFHLTNQTLSGTVTSVPDPPATEVSIGNLGDNPTTDQDDRYDWDTGATDNVFVINGDSATQAEFAAQVTVPDKLTYTRSDDTQTFTLTNVAPPEQSGTATNGPSTAPAGLGPDFGNDVIKAVNGGTTHTIEYETTDMFFVDGVLVIETEFEGAYSAGDHISYTPDNPDTDGTDEERIELKNGDLVGHLADVMTGATPGNDAEGERYDVRNSSGTTIYDDLDYTAAVFGGSDSYQVNGNPGTVSTFEFAINGHDGNDQIRVGGHPNATQHAFTSVS